MRYIWLFMFLCYGFLSAGQVNTIKLLKQEIKNTPDNTVKVDRIAKLCYIYSNIHPDSAIAWAHTGIELARVLKYRNGSAACQLGLGRAFMHYGLLDSASAKITEAKNIYEQTGNKNGLALALSNLSLFYGVMGNSQQDSIYSMEARKLAPFVTDTATLIFIYFRISDEFARKEMADSVLVYGRKAEKLSMASKDTASWAVSLAYLGYAYDRLKIPPGRLGCRARALTLNQAIGNNRGASQDYDVLAYEYYKLNKKDTALLYAGRSLEIAKKFHFAYTAMTALNTISIIHEGVDDKLALNYYKQYHESYTELYKKQRSEEIKQAVAAKEEEMRKQELVAKKIYRDKVLQTALLGCLLVFLLVVLILIRNNKKKQKAYLKAEHTLAELRRTQSQLVQSEKMASLGELTAGIAHEIQNPLNFMNNFSELNKELVDEMKTEINAGNISEGLKIANAIRENEEKIFNHGKRADSIVKNMLQHTRDRSGKKEPVDINSLAEEYIKLAYHGMRAKDKTFDAKVVTDFDKNLGKVNVIPQDIGRALLNLINNAFYAVSQQTSTGNQFRTFSPTVSVSTRKENGKLTIQVMDNGSGIKDKYLDKIFQPFFTTKPAGQGTGLGLSLSYDIIKAHGGDIQVESSPGKWCRFIVSLPA